MEIGELVGKGYIPLTPGWERSHSEMPVTS
jgi:hypothetical protein